jgi:hypothetical protein
MNLKDDILKAIDKLLHGKNKEYHDNINILNITGEIFATMIHQDGSKETYEKHNIVVERASTLIARLLIGETLQPGATYTDIYGKSTAEKIRGITHLAVGIGKPYESYNSGEGKFLALSGDDISDVYNIQGLPQEWDKQNPPGSTVNGGRILEEGDALWENSRIDKSVLVNEMGRKKFQKVQFLKIVDNEYEASAYPTNIIELECEFGETEAVGALMEMGLFGGNVEPFDRDYISIAHLEEYGDMVNYRTFKVWNKSNTDRLQIRWRITIPLNDSIPEVAD